MAVATVPTRTKFRASQAHNAVVVHAVKVVNKTPDKTKVHAEIAPRANRE